MPLQAVCAEKTKVIPMNANYFDQYEEHPFRHFSELTRYWWRLFTFLVKNAPIMPVTRFVQVSPKLISFCVLLFVIPTVLRTLAK